jgi:oligopeptide transport system substrate-binding protein
VTRGLSNPTVVRVFVALALTASILGAAAMAERGGSIGASSPIAGRDVVRILGGEPASIDPARHGDLGSARFIGQLFETLTAVDPSLTIRPALAESWSIEDEVRRVVFTLRPDLAFSDGTPLTADDVVRSWRRLVDPERPSPLASLIADVVGVRDLLAGRSRDVRDLGVSSSGPRTVVVLLERGGGDLPAIVSGPPFAVVPPGVGDEIVPRPGSFASSGGYVLAGIEDDAIILEANDRYWAGVPAIPTARWVMDLGGRSSVDAFVAGELDYTEIGWFDAGWLAYAEEHGTSLRREASLSVTYYGFDAGEPPFDDVRVRRAFALAVDWRRLAELDPAGSSVPATGMVPEGIPGRPEGDYLPPYDPDEARRLLAEAGYPGGRGLPEVDFITSGGGDDEAIVSELRSVLGVQVDYAVMDFGELLRRRSEDPPAIWSVSWVADYPGPNDFLGVLLGTGSTSNQGRWSSPAFDAAIADATSASTPEAAEVAFARALEIVRDEVPVVPVRYGVSWALARDGLLGATEAGTGIVRLAGLAWEAE